MDDSDSMPETAPRKATLLETATNIFAAPSEAFSELNARPTKLFPLLLIMLCVMAANAWYFTILDYDWFIDDMLTQVGSLSEEELESAREAMASLSQRNMMFLRVFGGAFGLLAIFVLQAGYLSLASALKGDKYRFSHWFSLICWTSLPYLLSVLTMVVNIVLNSNGQLSSFELNALTLSNLGIQPDNDSMRQLFNTIDLTMLWSMVLVVMAYNQWLDSGWMKAMAVVLAPYLLIIGVWTYFALS
jgi:hypothetical protein